MIVGQDVLRRMIRRHLGANSLVYRTTSLATDQSYILLREGFTGWWNIRSLSRKRGNSSQVQIKFHNLIHPMQVRPGTEDIKSVVSNIVREEYGRLQLTHDPCFIVDAGSYIGDTTAYFLSKYQTCEVIALEPNPVSFDLAKKNLAPYGERIKLLQAALWVHGRTTLRLSGEETAARVGVKFGVKVDTVTLRELLTMSPNGRINVLKLDIEGAEEAVFSEKPEDWLPHVDHIIVETHGAHIERIVLTTLAAWGWRVGRHRSLLYCSAPQAAG